MTDYRRGLPFATIQKAVDTAASLDLGIFNVTINVAAGTYSESVNLKTLVGAGEVLIVGDESVPANVVVAPASGWAFAPASAIVGTYRLRGFRLSSVDGFCVDALGAGCAVYFRNIEFANGGAAHIKAERLGLVEAEGDYSIVGDADRHWWSANQGIVSVVSRTITLGGTPNFSHTFAYANVAGLITCAANTFAGSATGARYDCRENSTIRSNGAVLPGNATGSTSDGGVYT